MSVRLKPNRDKPVGNRHPWIFSGAIAHIDSSDADGEIVEVFAASGKWLARGYLNRRSQIQVRILTWAQDEMIDADFWRRRLQSALDARAYLAAQTNALRLVNAESDYLPGLTVDRFGNWLAIQVGTLGIERRKHEIAPLLLELTGARGVVERSEMSARRQEGLPDASGVLLGEQPPAMIEVVEAGHTFLVDLMHGQKTGFYSDQRTNRQRVAAYCAGKRVLNAFSYTGAFAVHALAAGATHVTNIDASLDALEIAEQNLLGNGFDESRYTLIAGDVFQVLRDWRKQEGQRQNFAVGVQAQDAGESEEPHLHDVIILDPPKFASTQAQLDRALRGYKDINLGALKLLKPGGILATFSCSGLVSADLFQKVVFGAAVDAGREVQILAWLHQDADHPVAITFPEGEYLKGLICRVS